MLRLRPTFKGALTAALALLAFLLGSGLGHPYLNLSGYVLVGVLLVCSALGGLALWGVRLEALGARRSGVASGADVWVSLNSAGPAGPFGLDVTGYPGAEVLVHAPDRIGRRFFLPEPPETTYAELRSLPLGLVEISRRVPVAWMTPKSLESHQGRAQPLTQAAEPDGRIREHRPGENMRHVHWPLTSRLQRLMVRERERAYEVRPMPSHVREVGTPGENVELDLGVMRAFTVLATMGAIAFLCLQGALSITATALLIPLVLLGGAFSLRRAGPPSRVLLAALYIGILAILGVFVSDLRVNVLTRGPIAWTVMSVAALFAWDLRDRSYIRAQLFLVLFASLLLPAFFPPRDGQGVGLAFAFVMVTLLLAAWADGRHAIGATRVRLSELGSLTTAIVPFSFCAALVLVLHPWLPALPLPSLPTFGMTQVRARDNGPDVRVPGQEGRISLDARWASDSRPAVEVQGGSERLRTEVFETYRDGHWSRAPRRFSHWPSSAPGGSWIRLTLRADGMRSLPLPPGTVAIREALLEPMRRGDGTVHLSRPAWSGYTFEARVADSAPWDRTLPTDRERSAIGSLELRDWAQRLVGDAATPLEALERMERALRSDFTYDLLAEAAPEGVDPVVYFLTTSRRGFCVHFASAMALMAREVGIPTRFVAGYASGRQVGSKTIFEDRHAHAWVEAYVEGRWVTLDPTPGGSRGGGITLEQGRLVLAAALLLLAGAVIGVRRREPEPVRRYRRALRRLSRRGAPITEATTPEEALAMARDYLPTSEPEAFEDLVRRYEKARFSRP